MKMPILPVRPVFRAGYAVYRMSQEHTGRVGYEDLVPWDYPHTTGRGVEQGRVLYSVSAKCMFIRCAATWVSMMYGCMMLSPCLPPPQYAQL